MNGNGRGELVVDVSARIQVLKSSIDDVKKVLETLQPDSSGYKELEKIFKSLSSEMDNLQMLTSRTFKNQSDFNKTERSVGKIEDALDKAGIAMEKIDFSQIKLNPEQQEQLNNFKNKIKELSQELDVFKNKEKIGLFQNLDFKKFADSIDKNLIKKNFDAVEQVVKEKTENIKIALEKTADEIRRLEEDLPLGNDVKNFLKSMSGGVFDPSFFGDAASKIFNNKGGFKGGGKDVFYQYLIENFSLTPDQIEQLKDKTQKQMVAILSNIDFWDPRLKDSKINIDTLKGTYQELEGELKDAAAANEVLSGSSERVRQKTDETQASTEKARAGMAGLKEEVVNTTRSHEGYSQGTRQMRTELDGLITTLRQCNSEFTQMNQQQRAISSIQYAITNFMGFNQILNITKRAIKEAMDHIKQLDTTMNGIAIVSDMTTQDLWKQVDVYSEMAQRYGTSIQGAYEVSKIYYQAGYETNDVLTLMNETLKMSKISGLDYATTTDYMMNALRGFKLEVEDASRVVDVYSGLAQNTAVSQQELAEAMSKTASSMEGVGSTFEETSAMIATMTAVTRESATNIGSALKSIASRYGELTKDPMKLYDSEGDEMNFNKVDEALKSVGINMHTADNQFRSFTDVVKELSGVWDTLDSTQQRYGIPIL